MNTLLIRNGVEKLWPTDEVKMLQSRGWAIVDKKPAKEDGSNEGGGNFDRAEAIKKLKEKGVSVHHASGIDKLKALLVEHGIEF